MNSNTLIPCLLSIIIFGATGVAGARDLKQSIRTYCDSFSPVEFRSRTPTELVAWNVAEAYKNGVRAGIEVRSSRLRLTPNPFFKTTMVPDFIRTMLYGSLVTVRVAALSKDTLQEVRALFELVGAPFVAKIYGCQVVESTGEVYIVQEYLEGQELSDLSMKYYFQSLGRPKRMDHYAKLAWIAENIWAHGLEGVSFAQDNIRYSVDSNTISLIELTGVRFRPQQAVSNGWFVNSDSPQKEPHLSHELTDFVKIADLIAYLEWRSDFGLGDDLYTAARQAKVDILRKYKGCYNYNLVVLIEETLKRAGWGHNNIDSLLGEWTDINLTTLVYAMKLPRLYPFDLRTSVEVFQNLAIKVSKSWGFTLSTRYENPRAPEIASKKVDIAQVIKEAQSGCQVDPEKSFLMSSEAGKLIV